MQPLTIAIGSNEQVESESKEGGPGDHGITRPRKGPTYVDTPKESTQRHISKDENTAEPENRPEVGVTYKIHTRCKLYQLQSHTPR